MSAIASPFHLDQRIEGFAAPVAVGETVAVELPAGAGLAARIAAIQEQLAAAVARVPAPATVVSADCSTGVGVFAGRRRAGDDLGVVWFDAHGDFNTEETSPSGYLGGLPLAEISGRGERRIAGALGLEPLADERILLVGARDVDPGEEALLAESGVRRANVEDLAAGVVEPPPGPLYLHLDIDVSDPSYAPGLLYPVPGGPSLADLEAALRAVAAAGPVVATTLAQPLEPSAHGSEPLLTLGRRLLAAAT